MRTSHCFLRLLCASRCGGGGGDGSVKGIFQNAQVHSMWWWWYLYTLRKSSPTTCSLQSLCFYYAAELCAGSADVAVRGSVSMEADDINTSPSRQTILFWNTIVDGIFFFFSVRESAYVFAQTHHQLSFFLCTAENH